MERNANSPFGRSEASQPMTAAQQQRVNQANKERTGQSSRSIRQLEMASQNGQHTKLWSN